MRMCRPSEPKSMRKAKYIDCKSKSFMNFMIKTKRKTPSKERMDKIYIHTYSHALTHTYCVCGEVS